MIVERNNVFSNNKFDKYNNNKQDHNHTKEKKSKDIREGEETNSFFWSGYRDHIACSLLGGISPISEQRLPSH